MSYKFNGITDFESPIFIKSHISNKINLLESATVTALTGTSSSITSLYDWNSATTSTLTPSTNIMEHQLDFGASATYIADTLILTALSSGVTQIEVLAGASSPPLTSLGTWTTTFGANDFALFKFTNTTAYRYYSVKLTIPSGTVTLGEMILFDDTNLVYFALPEVIESYNINYSEKKGINELIDGTLTNWYIATKYNSVLSWKYLSLANVTSLKTIYDSKDSFGLIPEPFSKNDVYKCMWLNSFNFSYSTSNKIAGYSGNIEVREI